MYPFHYNKKGVEGKPWTGLLSFSGCTIYVLKHKWYFIKLIIRVKGFQYITKIYNI